MKNIQVIDGAENCTFCIFAAREEEFEILFPDGKDVEFADDLFIRLGDGVASALLSEIWRRPVDKKLMIGLHGTLFYQQKFRKKYFPTKRENEMIAHPSA